MNERSVLSIVQARPHNCEFLENLIIVFSFLVFWGLVYLL